MREGELDTGLLNRLAGSIPEDWNLILLYIIIVIDSRLVTE